MAASNCTFAGNTAQGGNGGNSRGNVSGAGDSGDGGNGAGGAVKEEGTSGCSIWYCTISGNRAIGGSGGADPDNGHSAGNPGGGYGGGIHTRFDYAIFIWSSIVAGNSGNHPDASGVIDSAGHNLIGINNGSSGWAGSDLTGYIDNNGTDFSLDPLLGPLQDNGGTTQTMLPLQGSAAIDYGGGGFTPVTDQRGLPRINDLSKYPNAPGGNGSDIGAVEVAGYFGTPRIWANTNGGNWSGTTNWSGGQVPGSNDVAVITLNGNYTVTLDVSPTIAGLVLGATVGTNKQTLATGGQTLSLNGSSIVNAQGVMNHSGGTLGGSGELSVHGAMNWSSGTINRSGGLSIGNSGTLNITGAGNNHDLPNTALTNSGKVVWSGGNVRGGGTTIVNKGEWDAQGDVPISQAFGGTVNVDNTGTFKKSAGSGALAMGANVFLKNSGLVDVQAGRMDFNGGGTNDAGTFNAGTNGTVNFNTSYAFNNGTKLLGAGSKQFVAGTFALNGTITTTNLTHTGGTLTGSPTLDGEFIWGSGALWGGAGAVTIAPTGNLKILGSGNHDLSGRVLTNNGTVVWAAGTLTDGDGGVIYNNGLWDVRGDNNFVWNNNQPVPVFNNAGTFRKSAGSGTTAFGGSSTTIFNNTGTLAVQSGTVNLAGNGANTAPGVFNTTNGATLLFTGNYTFNTGSQFTGNGDMQLAAGTFALNGNITFTKLTQTGGALSGTHVLSGLFTFGGGNWNTEGATTISSGSTLNITNNLNMSLRTVINNGTVTWTTGTLTDGDGGVIYNNGLWDVRADNNFVWNNNRPVPVFNNAGTFLKSGGNGTTAFGGSSTTIFNNTGTLDVQSGTVNLAGNGANTAPGVFNATNGATLLFTGNYTFNTGSQFTGNGDMQLAAGTFALNGNITFTKLTQTGGALSGTHVLNGVFTFGGGLWATSGATTISSGSTLNITNALNVSLRTVTNNGTVTWTGGTVTGGNGAVIKNNGLWDARGDNNITWNQTQPVLIFNNTQTFRKSAGTGTTTFAGSGFTIFNNTGVLDVQSGTVNLAGNGANTAPGVFNATNGATLLFTGNYTFNTGSQFTGNGDMQLAAGTFALNGNITFTKLTQTGGTLAGTHVLSGLFTFGGGNWNTAGATTISSGSTLNITNNLNVSLRTVINNGTVSWTTGTLTDGDGGVIYNNGLWDVRGDNNFVWNGNQPVPVFNNAGTFLKSGGNGTTAFGGSSTTIFNNTGTLDVQSGTVSPSSIRNLTGGTINIGISSLSNFGKVLLSGAAGLTGQFKANLIGNYVPAPGSAFPVISYGSLSGTFASFNLPANNDWQTNYGSTTFTLTAQSVLSYPPAQLQSPQLSGNAFEFGIPTVNNLNYTVLFNSNLGTTNWQAYTNLTGDGSILQMLIPLTNSQGYFRVSQP